MESIIGIRKKDVIMINLKIMESNINLIVVQTYIMKDSIERDTSQPIMEMQDIMNTTNRTLDHLQMGDGIMNLIPLMM